MKIGTSTKIHHLKYPSTKAIGFNINIFSFFCEKIKKTFKALI